MSINDHLNNSKLQGWIGPDGLRVLAKAIKKVFSDSDANADVVLDALQLKSRAMFTWLEKSAPQEIADLKDLNIPSTDCVLRLVKAADDIYSGTLTKQDKTTEDFVGIPLSQVASKLLLLPDFENELNKSEQYKNLNELQQVVDFLVGNFLFGEQKKNTLILEKGETQSLCPDCGGKIKIAPEGNQFCICYKIFNKNSLHIAKSEDGKMKITFSSGWDKYNIFLLAQALKSSLKK